jgi:DNA-directed RNA polymerase sigma subunit (sigma70/sigma32)
MACLDRREKRIVRMYFGLDDGEKKTLAEISVRHGISRERARQILKVGKAKMAKAGKRLG